MRGSEEYLIFQQLYQQLFQGSAGGLAYAVYVAAMFAVLIWRKESVVNWTLFRVSYLLFGAALIVPHLVLSLIPLGSAYRGLNDAGTVILRAVTGPALFAVAVVCGLASMAPRRARTMHPEPKSPHPLD